jgi:hypothetical protein
MSSWPCANGAAVKFGRKLFRLWLVGTSLWIIGCSFVIYNAYQEPYDIWLFLDPEDEQYRQCWPQTAPTESSVAQHAARVQRVATCYRVLNRIRQTTTRFDVLKQGIVTIVAVPALVLGAGSLLLSFTSYRRRSDDREPSASRSGRRVSGA